MNIPTRADAIARAPRPWLTREKGECAFPSAGEEVSLLSCCNPCGTDAYCGPHAAIMRGPRVSSPANLERAIILFLERRDEP